MAVTGTEGLFLLIARVLFGGVVAFMGLNHFLQTDQLAGYAEHKGLPAPRLGVLGTGAVLLLGGLAIVAGIYPVLGSLAVAAFLVVAALLIHNFWAVPDEEVQSEMTNFLKNIAMAGAAVGFAALGWQEWAFSVGLGLF